jgi:hypothetical protein
MNVKKFSIDTDLTINKNQEQDLLQILRDTNSYFCNAANGDTLAFDKADVDIMCCNIRNDFSILRNTSIGSKLEEVINYEKIIKNLKNSAEKMASKIIELDTAAAASRLKTNSLISELLKYNSNSEFIYNSFSLKEIINVKLENDIELSNIDKDFILKIIE